MNIEKDTQSIKLHSGKTVHAVKKGSQPKAALSRAELGTLHLMPTSDPMAFTCTDDGKVYFYFSPDNVTVTPPELWYPEGDTAEMQPKTLEDGSVIPLMDKDTAENSGYYTHEKLESLHLSVVEQPVAYMYEKNDDGTDKEDVTYLYDIRTCVRQALLCVRCGKEDRFRNKLCRKCYERDMLKRRKTGDAYRESVTGIDRGKAIFFDLELTGVYPYDEIISVSITDGWGNEIMDTIVRPERRKQWNITVKIHGITPKMTKYAPYLSEITPKIKKILLDSEIIVAYGIATDYSHIKEIFTEEERAQLVGKLRDCAKEYVRYISEYEPDINKSSLVSATEYFGIEWSGTAHTSMADTHACRLVWDKLFPNCYKEADISESKDTEIIREINAMPETAHVTFDEAHALAEKDAPAEPAKTAPKSSKPKKKKPASAKAQNSKTGSAKPQATASKQTSKKTLQPAATPAPSPQAKPSENKKSGLFGFFKRIMNSADRHN